MWQSRDGEFAVRLFTLYGEVTDDCSFPTGFEECANVLNC